MTARTLADLIAQADALADLVAEAEAIGYARWTPTGAPAMTTRTEIRISHHLHGETRRTSTHRVTSAAGIARLLTPAGEGWGCALWMSRTALVRLGGYETKSGEHVLPLPGRDPVSVEIDADTRSVGILIRVSVAEREQLAASARALGLPLGAWLRDLGMRQRAG